MTGYESFGLLHMIGVLYVGFVTGFGILADEVWGTGATIKQSNNGTDPAHHLLVNLPKDAGSSRGYGRGT